MNTSTSHYPSAAVSERIETRTLCVLVDNEPGVLARVIGLFAGRGYNIDSLTVSETEHEKHLSRITIVTRGTPMVLEQIKNQLDRLGGRSGGVVRGGCVRFRGHGDYSELSDQLPLSPGGRGW